MKRLIRLDEQQMMIRMRKEIFLNKESYCCEEEIYCRFCYEGLCILRTCCFEDKDLESEYKFLFHPRYWTKNEQKSFFDYCDFAQPPKEE